MSGILAIYQQVAKFSPNPMQKEIFTRIETENPALLLKAPTGSGKTEAVLIPSLAANRRLFLMLPSRSLVDDQISRCEKYLRRASKKFEKSYALVVDTGAESARTVFRDGAREEPGKRHLYDGNVILTTFDKFLYRFFGFGEPRKSYIYPFRIRYSHYQNLFCFDEAHAYDNVAFVNFKRLMEALYKANLDIVVMTATMPEAYQAELDFLDTIDYTTGANYQRLVAFQKKSTSNKGVKHTPNKRVKHIPAKPKDVSDKICAYVSQRYEPDKRTIVTIETIQDLVPVYQSMKKHGSSENILLYHGRLSDSQRKRVYRKLTEREKKDKGYLLFTTSAIEVGCDLDANLLITELCNPDSLIQRAGRCNRKAKMPDAEIVVVGNKIRPFLSTLSEEKTETYLKILRQQGADRFIPDDILRLMTYEPHVDYRAEILFDMLYEYVYEARLENKPLHERGLIITRSFEPSITLTTKVPESPGQRPENPVAVAIRSCIAAKDKPVNPTLKVYHRDYDKINEEFRFVPLSYGGSIYFKDLFVEVPEADFCQELGYVEPPIVFEDRGIRGYRHNFSYEAIDEDGVHRRIWLHYLRDLEKPASEETTLLPSPGPIEPETSNPVEPVSSPTEQAKQLPLF